MIGLPASDRTLRLRMLAWWHRDRIAVHEAAGSKAGVTRRHSDLRNVIAVAAQLGIQSVADA